MTLFITDILDKGIQLALAGNNASVAWLLVTIAFIARLLYSIAKGDFKYIFNWNLQRKESLIELLKSINATDFDSQNTKVILKETIEYDLFKRQTKMNVSMEMREKILQLYYDNKSLISWNRVKQAASYLHLNEDQEVYVKLSFTDNLAFGIFVFFEVLFAGGWASAYVFMLIRNPKDPSILLMLIFLFPVLLVIVLFAIPINKILAARFIRKEVEEKV
jgi:hypothetical protein